MVGGVFLPSTSVSRIQAPGSRSSFGIRFPIGEDEGLAGMGVGTTLRTGISFVDASFVADTLGVGSLPVLGGQDEVGLGWGAPIPPLSPGGWGY